MPGNLVQSCNQVHPKLGTCSQLRRATHQWPLEFEDVSFEFWNFTVTLKFTVPKSVQRSPPNNIDSWSTWLMAPDLFPPVSSRSKRLHGLHRKPFRKEAGPVSKHLGLNLAGSVGSRSHSARPHSGCPSCPIFPDRMRGFPEEESQMREFPGSTSTYIYIMCVNISKDM